MEKSESTRRRLELSTTDHDESKLPRWAQETLRFLRDEIKDLKAEKQQRSDIGMRS